MKSAQAIMWRNNQQNNTAQHWHLQYQPYQNDVNLTGPGLSPVYHLLLCHRCRIDEEVTHKAWLNRSNILFTGTDKWSLDKRVTLVNSNNSDFSIHIDKVQVTDEGPYTCTFQANNMPRIAHVYLIVQGWQPRWRCNRNQSREKR